jgi:hypothetical protein
MKWHKRTARHSSFGSVGIPLMQNSGMAAIPPHFQRTAPASSLPYYAPAVCGSLPSWRRSRCLNIDVTGLCLFELAGPVQARCNLGYSRLPANQELGIGTNIRHRNQVCFITSIYIVNCILMPFHSIACEKCPGIPNHRNSHKPVQFDPFYSNRSLAKDKCISVTPPTPRRKQKLKHD